MPAERAKLGCQVDKKEYVLSYEGNEAFAERLLQEADVVIAGEAPEGLVRQRVKAGKLLFRYRERPLRQGLEPVKYLPRLLRWHWRDPVWKPIYLLCASAYAAEDYEKFGLFRKRAFRWGYFPECREYDVETLMADKNPASILWCGRMVELKHPEAALLAVKQVTELGYRCTLDFVGSGPMEQTLRRMVREAGMDNVRFWGIQSAQEVRWHMERAGIFLFTSDRREGWGAVVNEAMNSGCAVIASRAGGSVPYLIADGENGLVYAEFDRLEEKLERLLRDPGEQARMGAKACQTVAQTWNGQEAARRLVQLAQMLLRGEDGRGLYDEGPCSPA